MNKNRFRIIFNVARGVMMVVAEFVKSHTASAESPANSTMVNASSQSARNATVTMRPLAFAMMLALGLIGIVPNPITIKPAHADIMADPTAPTNQRPLVMNAANGVPLVNIQTPSVAGVSRNTYSQFDVNANGAILNNSRTNVQTQLGGWVQGNPYLANGTARIILNEVNSHNPSLLNGYVEVAGNRAQVVIANPAGISCNGCGFINASRATLTTGTPIINHGDLMGYRVGGGVVNISGSGLDTANSNYTNVIARAVNVNAGLWAQDLNIIAGINQVNVASNGEVTGITSISPNATLPNGSSNPTPGFAIDVAALGGMYAGKIHLIGTEAGVGVSNAGSIGASVGEVSIDVNGNLTNSHRISSTTQTNINAAGISNTGGTLSAGQLLNINANSLSGDGQLHSGGDATLTLSSDYTQTASGKIQANGNLTFTTTGNLTNQSSLLAGNTLTLNAVNIDNTATAEITGLNTHINASNTLTNRGVIDGSDTFITANVLNNIGTGSIFGDHIAIAANTLNNLDETVNSIHTAAVIAARNRLDIGAGSITNQNNALMFSAGEMAIGGSLDVNHDATVALGQTQVATLINQGATIEALGNLTINVANLQNLNAGISTTTTADAAIGFDQFRPDGGAGSQNYLLNSADYPIWDIGNFNMSWRYGAAYSLPFNFRHYWRYLGTSTTTHTQVSASQPAQILSGLQMTMLGNITNSDSKIIAGGLLDVSGATLNSLNSQGQHITSYSGTVYYYDYDGNESCGDPGDGCYDISASPYNPANSVGTFNLATTQLAQNTSPASVGAASGTNVATLNATTLPNSSLFQANPNPNGSYLIETNPRFTNYRTWLSSDYMLSTLPYNQAITTKRLGDGFYEQKLIREQVAQLTGHRFMAGYADDEAQYQALMNSGITFAQAYTLIPGVALSDTQIAQLTSDIVWLVEQDVTLPDGTLTKALVPQVYVKLRESDLSNTGSLLAGNAIQLDLSGDLSNQGTIAGRTIVAITANNINNLGGRIDGNQTQLTARRDPATGSGGNISNLGGTVSARDALMLNADRDIKVASTTQSAGNQVGESTFSRTNLDRVAGLYVTNPSGTGILVASAGNNIQFTAAQLINLAPTGTGASRSTTGQTILSAGHDLNLDTVTIAEQNNSVRNAKNYVKHGNTQEVGTSIQTEGDVILSANNNITVRAATVESAEGALNVNAGNYIDIEAGKATSNVATARYVKKSGSFSSKKTTTRDSFNDSTAMESSLSADRISINAGQSANASTGGINITGSNVVANNNVDLNATGNITLATAQNTHDETHFKSVKKTGFSATSTSIGYGNSKLTNTNDSQQVTNVGSTIGSIEGDVNINTGKTYNQTGSDVLVPEGDINITAQQVNITAATDTYANQQTMKYKQTGITLAVTSPVISAIQTVSQMSKAASETDDTRMKALAAGTTALAANNAKDAIIAGNTPKLDENGLQVLDANGNNTAENPANQVGGVNVSLSIGTSQSSSKTTQTNSTAKSSTLNAGGDVNITAKVIPSPVSGRWVGGEGDINVIGSTIKAAHDVTLKADDQINLQAAQNVDTLNGKSKGSSASIGVSFGTDGLLFTVGASGSKGKTNGNGTTWTETQIQAGSSLSIGERAEGEGKVTLNSGTDTKLIGAQVSGNQIIANVGTSGAGNLNIESLQDTNQYKDKQQSIGGSISVGYGRWSASGNYSDSKTKSNYASVNEQSGIMAGDGGFQVNVNGNTDLKGAVIASTLPSPASGRGVGGEGDNRNSLTTQTLTTSNIENSAEYSAKGVSISAGVNVGLTQNNQPVAGVTKSLGWGSLSDDANSVTVSGISGGKLSIADNATQQVLTGKDSVTTVETLNRDVKTQFSTDSQGNMVAIAVDSNGNDVAQAINPIFNAEKVQQELDAQLQITQAFDQAQQQFRMEINKKVDEAKSERDSIANNLKNQDLSEEQRMNLINQGLNAQKEIEQFESIGLIFSAVAGGLSAPTGSIGGIIANSLAPEAANQIGQYFKDHGTEGSAPHILAHGVLASAVAALGGNDPMGAALSAMGGEIAAPLVADLLYGKPSEELNAEQKSTVSAIASLGGIAASASVSGNVTDIAQANLSAQNAVDNNWGEVGHYSTMATILYLAGFSPKDAKAVALAAWGPDTDKRNAMNPSNVSDANQPNSDQKIGHLLDGQKDIAKVIAKQQELAKEVGEILQTIKQYENDPVKKAEYLTTPSVQKALHAFGDAFAHVDSDGTHYPPGRGHFTDSVTNAVFGNNPDSPQTHPNAYKSYVNTLFSIASQTTATPRVSNSTVSNLADMVTIPTTEFGQQLILYSAIGSVTKKEATSLVRSPVGDCGSFGCSDKPISSQVTPQINSIYGIKK